MAEFDRRIRRIARYQRVGRVFRDRQNPLEYLSREEVRDRYRFYPESIICLLHELNGLLDCPTRRSLPLPPMLTLLVTLHFYASASHFIVIADLHGVSKSSVSRAVRRTTLAINSLMNVYIKMPANNEVPLVKREFYNVARFPQVVGAIDGTHINIQAPSQNEPDFVNRKGNHSINVQMICDARFKILNIVSKWPGSVHDSRIFRESLVCRDFELGNIDGLLIGDSGYACRPFLMTPYLNPSTVTQERFNEALTKTRMVIEQTFGILKRRFPCLKYGLRLDPSYSCKVIIACAVLHNFGQTKGDILYREIDVALDSPDPNRPIPTISGSRFRDIFATQFFS